ncbi:hypothetical protein NDU88_007848 [Pleurodeles waltl]|uniref:Uncharacterized protein n=1 Tax=Pleurodeles waltl TaxID=8319 RepID=A0AAV7PN30_PLEWA|nr:hypothetical protein NDU88_007848 [Pleurodeles waltl]
MSSVSTSVTAPKRQRPGPMEWHRVLDMAPRRKPQEELHDSKAAVRRRCRGKGRQGLLSDTAERPSQGPSGITRSDWESPTRRGAAGLESVSPSPSGAASEERPWARLWSHGLELGSAPGREGREEVRSAAAPPTVIAVNRATLRRHSGSAPRHGGDGASPLTSEAVEAAAGAPGPGRSK